MSLEQTQLDPYFLAKIFTQPIIPGKSMPAEAVEKVAPKVKYLGENQKNIALFIQNENEAYLNEELFNLLTNILNACKLGMQDVSLINVIHYPSLAFPAWQAAVKIERSVVFGIAPEQLGLNDIPLYQLVTVNGTTLLFSDELSLIGSDKVLKARLWAGLKQLLGI
ncbi:hypothetical protein SAMN05660461_3521 [Chitinophaga ginsengisegetis]|uniref:Uncharacterized protein n=1 Tax=Chitinophaga ginsengisegetis TaxID=393003 RepID=A0A1T5P1W1_9BACT|nr:hypothetical protein [Chitinophaga ginsengisegetis]MDR6566747.1 hypothetical protein [Chitinophaga ginsengisegetis]MDR6646477.1 hypothetical protein [Chitinophaga ginsengisegetis]MDR6652827.1 hypothetical protein [Chitinophaga ginsengisegetis]SKD06694.1 hypothetical protein SAMN05660461_3521 [Chitinophaga ginsengisegetis]